MSTSSDFGRKEILGGLAATGGALTFPHEVTNAVNFIAGGVNYLMDTGVHAVSSAGNEVGAGFIGTLAPFTLPAIAGGYAGKSIADIARIENKTLKRAMMVGGALGGAAISTSVLAPYLVGGMAAYAIGKKPFKWVLNKAGSVTGAIYDGTVGIPVGAAKGMWNGAKNGFNQPTVIPQV